MLVIFAASVLFYAKSAFFPFAAIDDHVYVTGNPNVALGFSRHSLSWAFTTFHAANWHPVTWLSLMLDGQLFGPNPAGYHLVNVLLHGANAALLFLFLARLTGAAGKSAFVAACFALHPMHVESVAWITERKDVLSTLFLLGTLLLYLVFLRSGRRRDYVVALFCYALGLMAKPMLVTLPVLLFLLDLWPLGRLPLPPRSAPAPPAPGWGRLLGEKLPFLLLALSSALVTLFAQGRGEAVASLTQIPFPYRLANALWSALMYLVKGLAPHGLAVYYPFALVPWWKAALAGLILAAVTLLAWAGIRRRGWLPFGWGWFLVTLLPVIGLVQVGSQAMADRYSYLPHMGLFVVLAWGGEELGARLKLPERGVQAAAAALLLFFSAASWLQLGLWQDNERLLRRTLAVTEKNYFAHFALGGYLEERGELDRALDEYWEVLRINPGAKGIHLYLGTALAKKGRAEEAIGYLDEALRRNPRLPSAHFYLGTCHERQGRIEQALACYRRAVEGDPANPRYHTNLGAALARMGLLGQAAESFGRALALDPADPKAARYLEQVRTLQGAPPGGRHDR